jgi:hypothetical protein
MHVSFFLSFFPTDIVQYRQNEYNRFITSRTSIEIDVAVAIEREHKKKEEEEKVLRTTTRGTTLLLFFCITKQDNTQTTTSI